MAEPEKAKIRSAGLQDEPSPTDHLGFAPYVGAIADFLENKETIPPFTLSIEGDWGSGKSSFMMQLRDFLEKNKATTINFNAWRHDKVESMWSTFALTFISQLEKKISWYKRPFLNLKLSICRFDFQRGWGDLVLKMTLIFLYGVLTYAFFKQNGFSQILQLLSINETGKAEDIDISKIINSLGFIGLLIGTVFFIKKVADVFGNPLSIDLKKYNTKPDFSAKTEFIDTFHLDFNRAVNVLAGKKNKIYVFIDDLDRAEIPKAAELMQGLNMMISNSKKIIFIIGMDREKVAAGVAAKYEGLIKYLYPSSKEDVQQGLRFGSDFLQKFIQLSFHIPAPAKTDIKRFIKSLSKKEIEKAQKEEGDKTIEHATWLEDGDDADSFINTIELVADYFENNPRLLKQFINAYRLKCHIAFRTGLLIQPDPITIEQIGKFVAMITLWPSMIDKLITYPDTIKETLKDLPGGQVYHANALELRRNERFLKYLELGTDNNKFDMTNVNYQLLIKTSPAINIGEVNSLEQNKGTSNPNSNNQNTTTDLKSTADNKIPINFEDEFKIITDNPTGSTTTTTTTTQYPNVK